VLRCGRVTHARMYHFIYYILHTEILYSTVDHRVCKTELRYTDKNNNLTVVGFLIILNSDSDFRFFF
jgi:hypothetical protein